MASDADLMRLTDDLIHGEARVEHVPVGDVERIIRLLVRRVAELHSAAAVVVGVRDCDEQSDDLAHVPLLCRAIDALEAAMDGLAADTERTEP